ncbi:ribonuclease III [Synechococcus sp. BIOS-U3-1]|uniref:ribonuclease III n=1 Tax=Synechococcus sp. BIOS-U3-1 TaxID=1400865 RepID=UPI00164658E0|nr:ribonuclease III [Synechococcus sp. BIOS-U3-1]QNI57104.1 ribonuclease III [Synechococcus sp. BIOS-U3-1]
MSQPSRPLEQLWATLTQSSKTLGKQDLALLQEALTHTSSGLNPHHEQLEFLGDAVLRLTASEFIASAYPRMPVGERSSLRAQLVSDRWLAELGSKIEIEHWWQIGPKASGDSTAAVTIRAELSEALIGAVYRIHGLTAVHQWLTPHWQSSAEAVLSDPHRGNCKSALQEWSQGEGLGLPTYTSKEMSQLHGDPRRFRCSVNLPPHLAAEGWGRSRRDAEQQAARAALDQLADIGADTSRSAPH